MSIDPDIGYDAGTVAVDTNGNVTGTSVLWDLIHALDEISVDGGALAKITEVTDATHMKIRPWSGGAVSGKNYVITYSSPLRLANGELAIRANELVKAITGDGYYIYVKPGAGEPEPSKGLDGQYALQPSTGKLWLKAAGVWVYRGTFGNFRFSSTPWSGATTYDVGDAVPFSGAVWVSLQAGNLNHRPDLSPTWWQQIVTGGDVVYIVCDDSGRPGSGETLLKFVTPKSMTVYATMADSVAKAGAAAASSSVFSIRKNGSQFATLTFASADTTGAFSCAADVTFAAGDVLSIIAPSPRDATLADVSITILANR